MRTRFLLSTALAVLALGVTSGRLSAQGETSVCKDGTTSATVGKGACSGHGGVDTKATAAAKKKGSSTAASAAKTTPPTAAAKTPPAAPPAAAASKSAASTGAAKTTPATKTAKASEKDSTGAVAACKDGTYSHSATHKGACSRHGGVAKFLKP